MADLIAPNVVGSYSSPPLSADILRHHLSTTLPLSPRSSYSSIHNNGMPSRRRLRLLVAANGQRDVAYAQTIAIRLLKDSHIETRALVDEIPLRLTHDIMVLENQSISPFPTNYDKNNHETAEVARHKAFELVEWADIMVLAPIDADHLAKMLSGIADTTLLEVLRAWDVSKKILLVPGMSIQMWHNPMTKKQLSKIKKNWTWVKVMSPILWHYDGPTLTKRVAPWEGLNDLVGIVKNQAELLSLGHDVEAAVQHGTHRSNHRCNIALPAELWTLIFQHVGDWELAQALNIYTDLRPPPDWRVDRASLRDPIEIYTHELQWLILSCPESEAICRKLAEAPRGLRFLSLLTAKLIVKFALIDVLTYLETNLKKVFWATFSGKILPNKASGAYSRIEVLDWWNTSPSFLGKEYDPEALNSASRMGYVHILEWWLRSGLTMKYTEEALESASAMGYLPVLEWWRDAALQDDRILLKPGRSLLRAAQQGQVAVIQWWENSGIPVAHSESVCRVASAHGHTVVLEAWRELRSHRIAYDHQVLVAPTRMGYVDVLEWWKRHARRQEKECCACKVTYKTCDIEEALEDCIDPSQVKKWWAQNGLNLSLGPLDWMKPKAL